MLRLGCGAGFSSDRIGPAIELTEKGRLDWLVFETIGERTLAFGHRDRKLDPTKIKWNTSQPYTLSYRQKPGKDNPLGFVKINFHNAHSVYLHDTPSDRLFGRNFRAASSGCVRQAAAKASSSLRRERGSSRRSALSRVGTVRA